MASITAPDDGFADAQCQDASVTNEHGLAIGDPVDVHTKFTDTWVAGFKVAAIVPEGFRVRRQSDASLLPGHTSEFHLRPSSDNTPVPFS